MTDKARDKVDERLLVHMSAGKQTLAPPPAVPAGSAVPGVEDEDEGENAAAITGCPVFSLGLSVATKCEATKCEVTKCGD